MITYLFSKFSCDHLFSGVTKTYIPTVQMITYLARWWLMITYSAGCFLITYIFSRVSCNHLLSRVSYYRLFSWVPISWSPIQQGVLWSFFNNSVPWILTDEIKIHQPLNYFGTDPDFFQIWIQRGTGYLRTSVRYLPTYHTVNVYRFHKNIIKSCRIASNSIVKLSSSFAKMASDQESDHGI